MRFLLFALITALLLFAIDYYVYRRWIRFARKHPGWYRLRHLYRASMSIMPWVLPLYFSLSRWWEVEPKWIRALVIGFWGFYYIPKAWIALVLLAGDLVRFLSRPLRRRRSRPSITKPQARREFLEKIAWSSAAIPYVATGYSMIHTLYDFKVHRMQLPIPDLPRAFEGLRIVQISDLHAGSFLSTRPLEEVVQLVQRLHPDLLVITGDFVNHRAEELTILLPYLFRLKAPLGVFACLGNHDHYAPVNEVIAGVRQTPVQLLINEHQTLEMDGAFFHIIGTDNTGFGQNFGDLRRATRGLKRHPSGEEFRLLLAHDPSFWDRYVRPDYPDIDLTLSGHTHGGQIGMEVGPLRWSLAQIAYERWAGIYEEPASTPRGKQLLYVNRGIGTVGPPIRMGIRPEITVITLQRTS